MDEHLPFGLLLRRHRTALGLSQEQAAARAGMSWRTISDLERGINLSPRPDTLRLLVATVGLAGEERAGFEAAAHRGAQRAPDFPDRALALRASRAVAREVASPSTVTPWPVQAGSSPPPLAGRVEEPPAAWPGYMWRWRNSARSPVNPRNNDMPPGCCPGSPPSRRWAVVGHRGRKGDFSAAEYRRRARLQTDGQIRRSRIRRGEGWVGPGEWCEGQRQRQHRRAQGSQLYPHGRTVLSLCSWLTFLWDDPGVYPLHILLHAESGRHAKYAV
jgi:transcriptional regulator with XRE-family HTH domain